MSGWGVRMDRRTQIDKINKKLMEELRTSHDAELSIENALEEAYELGEHAQRDRDLQLARVKLLYVSGLNDPSVNRANEAIGDYIECLKAGKDPRF